jgi:SNF2 family DNA or RNA helicase
VIDLLGTPADLAPRQFTRGLSIGARGMRLLDSPPAIRGLGRLTLEVASEGWRFPAPVADGVAERAGLALQRAERSGRASTAPSKGTVTRLAPSPDTVVLKERLLYLLQPPLENLFAGRHVRLPTEPYPYQLEGIAFLMPRHAALLADEMGLGKTMQTIIALRLLFQAGLIGAALLVCPKPVVDNWRRELTHWAADLPFEIVGGDAEARRAAWLVSNCPLKVVNYEVLTRDAEILADERVHFDVVVLDEAQRIKNHSSKTARAVRAIRRQRSWALTGTPVENRHEDLVSIFSFVNPGHVPADTPVKLLSNMTAPYILRRTKDDVLTDLPPKTIRDLNVELTPAQRDAYSRAEREGIVCLNALGATITVQHVFELIMRLKQICNFDPLTGQSAKLERLEADLQEVADSGRKAIVFSQWVEPLIRLADALAPLGPLQFHGRLPAAQRPSVLRQFREDSDKHVLLATYGTGSVGLNLQSANYVFLFDRWWNPAVEDQAINRVHRIGQREPVFVTRFSAEDTIDGRIAEILERKRQLASDLIDQSGPPPTLGLSEEEIFGLFDIQARPRRATA